jgi:hypothetical protein
MLSRVDVQILVVDFFSELPDFPYVTYFVMVIYPKNKIV